MLKVNYVSGPYDKQESGNVGRRLDHIVKYGKSNLPDRVSQPVSWSTSKSARWLIFVKDP